MYYPYHVGVVVVYQEWNLETKYKDKVNIEKVNCKT